MPGVPPANADWAQKKKIDLRYHELSPQGYFEMLKGTGMVALIVDEAEIASACRNPPLGTPAAARSRYIREFSGSEEGLAVNWKYVFLGRGWGTRVIRLDRFQPLAPPTAATTETEPTDAED
jgi:proteasome accessory factor A